MKKAIFNPFTKNLSLYNEKGIIQTNFSGEIAAEKVKRLHPSFDVIISIDPKVKVQL